MEPVGIFILFIYFASVSMSYFAAVWCYFNNFKISLILLLWKNKWQKEEDKFLVSVPAGVHELPSFKSTFKGSCVRLWNAASDCRLTINLGDHESVRDVYDCPWHGLGDCSASEHAVRACFKTDCMAKVQTTVTVRPSHHRSFRLHGGRVGGSSSLGYVAQLLSKITRASQVSLCCPF